MKQKRWLPALALAAAAASAVPAFAQSTQSTAGFYAGATVGLNNDDESTWRLLGGYDVNRNFGVELGYHDIGDVNLSGSPADAKLWELAGIGRLPLDQRFSLYGKLGLYRAESKAPGREEKNNDLTFGAGVEYAFSRQASVRGEWQRYRDMGGGAFLEDDVDVYSIGVVYRFH